MSEYLPIISFVVGYLLSQAWIEYRYSRKTVKRNTADLERQFHVTREFIDSQCNYADSLQKRIAKGQADPISDRERHQLEELRQAFIKRFGHDPEDK